LSFSTVATQGGARVGETLDAKHEAHAAARPRAPLVLAESRSARRIERTLRVPADLAQLEGHFPGAPLVAGVVQLGWVMDAARALGARDLTAIVFEGLRFRDALTPEQELRLAVELSEAGDLARFQLTAGERVFGAGRVRFAAGARA
jgi:3-hydroxymyristoyl/3-hydroxydecanoyl-(acyl carrier protein) dehydratase